MKSLKQHKVPKWFHDAKLGVFIHWGLFSVPAFATPEAKDIHKNIKEGGWAWHFKNNPYAEWYLNTLRIPGSPTQKYHQETYGLDFAYEDFVPLFNEACMKWNPNEWADLFQKVGARYVVLVTKHCDGFCLWPTNYPNPYKENYIAKRDIVGELTKAVKTRNMRMGFYYIGPWDWTFNENPIQNFMTYVTNGPLELKFAEYVKNHWYELIDSYEPSILWGDIGYPPVGDEKELFAYFYNKYPDGVINDRWMKLGKNTRRLLKFWPIRALVSWLAKRAFIKGSATSLKPPHYDFLTPEYTTLKKITKDKWETTRGIGHSFGYNQMEPESNYLTVEELVHMFIDIVSKNGNLLLNVGPKADGSIPEIQKQRLLGLGKWLDVNGDAIFDTRPWKRAEDVTPEGIPVRYTQKENALYTILLAKPKGKSVTLKNMSFERKITVILLGDEMPLEIKQEGTTLTITLPDDIPSTPAISLKLSPLPK